ncbi:BZ3500_MvSof-1268-A1-R1_Chr1-3g01927 [Microbotryum saponariae]|nr:BZ3500_MvSof-1268-A1-R1_Chr1-3g01927 [Microbotryum saponariae]SCZ94923.1 BZ3501_MvSof-1269-A2-R1_Chr1-3g01529 [Microbotryum saponariae]
MSDPGSDPRLLRLSIGLEDFDDLKRDLIEGFNKVLAIEIGLTSSKL